MVKFPAFTSFASAARMQNVQVFPWGTRYKNKVINE
jgi:hypothetical protein